jgi:AraC-like DNA-binding protein
LEELSLFQPGHIPVFQLPGVEVAEIEYIFRKMQKELAADYKYKYDLLRNLVVELIHYGQKLQPMSALKQTSWSVADIAYSLGFDDVAHFSHYFKKQTAANPLAFRN